MAKAQSDHELSDGGILEYPEENGTIRRRDSNGNCEEVRRIGDADWSDWADVFGKIADDFRAVKATSSVRLTVNVDDVSGDPDFGALAAAIQDLRDDDDYVAVSELVNLTDQQTVLGILNRAYDNGYIETDDDQSFAGEDEQLRRDEKRGLYGQHQDPAN